MVALAWVSALAVVVKMDELVVIRLFCVDSEFKRVTSVTAEPSLSLVVTVLTTDDPASVNDCTSRMLLVTLAAMGAPPSRATTPSPASQQVVFRLS